MTLVEARRAARGIAEALAATVPGRWVTAVTLEIAAPDPLRLVRAALAAGLETAAWLTFDELAQRVSGRRATARRVERRA